MFNVHLLHVVLNLLLVEVNCIGLPLIISLLISSLGLSIHLLHLLLRNSQLKLQAITPGLEFMEEVLAVKGCSVPPLGPDLHQAKLIGQRHLLIFQLFVRIPNPWPYQ